jgi:hypothetical protein
MNRLSLEDLLSYLDKLPENKDRRKEPRFYPKNGYSSAYLRFEKLNVIFSADVIDVNSTSIRLATASGLPLEIEAIYFIHWRLSEDAFLTIKGKMQRIEEYQLISSLTLFFLEIQI